MRRAHRLALGAIVVLAAGTLGGDRIADAVRDASARARGDDPIEAQRTRDVPRNAHRAGEIVPAETVASLRSFAAAASDRERDAEPRERRPADASPRVVLDDPQIALGSAVAIRGRDVQGPRALALWRIEGDRAVRVARGRSEADGTLAFPAFVLPAGDVTLVATPLGARPGDPGASSPVALRRDPSAPHLESVAVSAEGTLDLRVAPVEAGGAIVVTAATPAGEVEIARVAVADDVERSRASLDLSLPLAADATSLSLAHELSDGRRSAPRAVSFPGPNPMEDLDVESVATVAP